ncbi:MAG: GNAT family N-acetyltransferase [Elainellaceae cyanobacterium]
MRQNTASLPVNLATKQNVEPIVHSLVLAFSADPAVRWMYPDPQQYLMSFPNFVNAFAGKAFEHEAAYYLDGYAGAALWLPPNIYPDDDRLMALLRHTVSEQMQTKVFAVFDQMSQYHPHEPHWYLPLIGIEPSQQRKGYGSALMKHALAQCDRDNTLAYLESSNPANIPFYEQHGFELLGRIQAAGSPAIFPMVRYP